MINYKDLECIKHTRTTQLGSHTEYLTYNQFKIGFVDERWLGETRSDVRMTLFGRHHHKAEIHQQNFYVLHTYDFPSSMEEAKALHQQNTKS